VKLRVSLPTKGLTPVGTEKQPKYSTTKVAADASPVTGSYTVNETTAPFPSGTADVLKMSAKGTGLVETTSTVGVLSTEDVVEEEAEDEAVGFGVIPLS
jgi:hypothetical protein